MGFRTLALVGELLVGAIGLFLVARVALWAARYGFAFNVALRYLGSKKRGYISIGTLCAILGVTLGVGALATVMSVTGGFHAQFREKILGVNAHVLVLKYSTDFREYRTIMEQVSKVPGVIGAAPFSINPMMLTHGDATATGVLLKGVDPALSLGAPIPPSEGTKAPPNPVPVLDLPKYIVENGRRLSEREAAVVLKDLRLPGAKPPPRSTDAPLPPPKPLDDIPDAGADEYDDAGRNLTKIRELQNDLNRRLEKSARGSDAGATPPDALDAGVADAGARGDAALDAGAQGPTGSIEPDGGYKSVLPDEDGLPTDVDPDPCSDPARVKSMPGIVIGVSLAKTLDLKVGDCLTVTSPTIGYSYSGGSLKPPVAKRFRLIALFEWGFDQYDSKLVYTDLYEAQTFYDQGDTVTGIEMRVADIDNAHAISRTIGEMLSTGLYHTMDWEELNRGLFTALRIQQIGMSTVLALIIVVAAFTVVATLIMVVLDKKKEIAVMKAMGAADESVLLIFLYQGGIIGLTGTLIGLAMGLAVCEGLLVYGFPLDPKVYFVSKLPVLVRPEEFLITGAVAIVICLTATVIPSLYAAKLRPVDGFRDQ